MNTKTLTQLAMDEADIKKAKKVARLLGYGDSAAYTSHSTLWGVFCLPTRPTQKRGCIIKTRELGFLFVQDLEDLDVGE